MALYIAADQPLPLIPWDETKPSFNVRELSERDLDVRVQFTKPHVYFLGSHEGCSCGFSYGQFPITNVKEESEDEKGRRSVLALQQYLTAVLHQTDEVHLFSCWDGDQNEPPVQILDIDPRYFGGGLFALPEKVAFRVHEHAGP